MTEAERSQLTPVGGDVLIGRRARVGAGLHRVLLRGETERVVAHRVEDVVSVHTLEARVHVGGDVTEWMTDVQPGTTRVREHVEHEQVRTVGDVARVLAQQTRAIGRVEDV